MPDKGLSAAPPPRPQTFHEHTCGAAWSSQTEGVNRAGGAGWGGVGWRFNRIVKDSASPWRTPETDRRSGVSTYSCPLPLWTHWSRSRHTQSQPAVRGERERERERERDLSSVILTENNLRKLQLMGKRVGASKLIKTCLLTWLLTVITHSPCSTKLIFPPPAVGFFFGSYFLIKLQPWQLDTRQCVCNGLGCFKTLNGQAQEEQGPL